MLAGANRIAVQNDDGAWEVIGFAAAELTAPQTYRLARLLRGQGGSDFAIGTSSVGNSVLLLDSRATLLPIGGSWLGTIAELRSYAGPADADGTLTAVAIGLDPVLPLAPVHLMAERAGAGDITLSWVRRSRADPDSWALDDAPLDYVPEAYRVTILDGMTPVRTIDTSTPQATYSAAQQSADFGLLPTSFDFIVSQVSPLYGPGHTATTTFTA